MQVSLIVPESSERFRKTSAAASMSISRTSAIDLSLYLTCNVSRLKRLPLANRARHPDVGQKVHFQFVGTISFASLAATAFHIEAESARREPAQFGLRHLGEQLANFIKHFDVGSRIGPRRSADRRLVDGNHFVQQFDPFDPIVDAWFADSAIEFACSATRPEISLTRRTLAAAADAGDANEHSQRNRDVDVFQVVVPRTDDAQSRFRSSGRAFRRNLDLLLPT